MGKLVYSMSVSLDGYVESPDRSLDWVDMDEELHAWFNERARATDAFLYGRRLYETMTYWSGAESDPNATPAMLDFARIWSSKPKIVFSTTLERVGPGFRLIRADPVGELGRLRAEFPGELSVGGPTLASAFVKRGLIDEYRIVVHPVLLGAGTRFFPALDMPVRLRHTATRTFASGATYLGYEPA